MASSSRAPTHEGKSLGIERGGRQDVRSGSICRSRCTSGLGLLYPDKQTLGVADRMSGTGQQQTCEQRSPAPCGAAPRFGDLLIGEAVAASSVEVQASVSLAG